MAKRLETFPKLNFLEMKHDRNFNEKEFYKIRKVLEEVPNIRDGKVNRIKKLIETNKYGPSSEKVASAVLNSQDLGPALCYYINLKIHSSGKDS